MSSEIKSSGKNGVRDSSLTHVDAVGASQAEIDTTTYFSMYFPNEILVKGGANWIDLKFCGNDWNVQVMITISVEQAKEIAERMLKAIKGEQ